MTYESRSGESGSPYTGAILQCLTSSIICYLFVDTLTYSEYVCTTAVEVCRRRTQLPNTYPSPPPPRTTSPIFSCTTPQSHPQRARGSEHVHGGSHATARTSQGHRSADQNVSVLAVCAPRSRSDFGWMIGWVIGWTIGWMIGWTIDWMIGRVID